jgi:hypothetical protein
MSRLAALVEKYRPQDEAVNSLRSGENGRSERCPYGVRRLTAMPRQPFAIGVGDGGDGDVWLESSRLMAQGLN